MRDPYSPTNSYLSTLASPGFRVYARNDVAVYVDVLVVVNVEGLMDVCGFIQKFTNTYSTTLTSTNTPTYTTTSSRTKMRDPYAHTNTHAYCHVHTHVCHSALDAEPTLMRDPYSPTHTSTTPPTSVIPHSDAEPIPMRNPYSPTNHHLSTSLPLGSTSGAE